MENEINELEQDSHIEAATLDQMWSLSEEILKDCQLKKGKKAKFIKHMERVTQIQSRFNRADVADEGLIIAFAALLKNIGKLGDHEESLAKAIQVISPLEHLKSVTVRWLLQFAALKSSKKQHQECYEIAVKAFDLCQQILAKWTVGGEIGEQKDSEVLFVEKVMDLSREKTKDEIIWLVNERSLAEEMLQQIRKTSGSRLHVPFYPTYDFHIADYMSLEECVRGWEEGQRAVAKEVVIYLSICCFTMATERYYLKDYSQKHNHLKALKIALAAFDINCSYVAFLLKILNQHFGKRLESIEEEHFETADRHEMKRLMPRDTKEVSMRFLQIPEE